MIHTRKFPVIRQIVALPIAAIFLTGCATTYKPEEVCTANWIKPRAQKAVAEIQEDTDSLIKTFRQSAKSFANGKQPGPIQMFQLSLAFDSFIKTLRDGSGVKSLKILSQTCNDPDIVKDAMSGFFRDQGVPNGVISIIEDLDAYRQIIDTSTDANVSPYS